MVATIAKLTDPAAPQYYEAGADDYYTGGGKRPQPLAWPRRRSSRPGRRGRSPDLPDAARRQMTDGTVLGTVRDGVARAYALDGT